MALLPVLAAGAAHAAPAPDGRTFQIIVGYPPGGGSDVLAREIGRASCRERVSTDV